MGNTPDQTEAVRRSGSSYIKGCNSGSEVSVTSSSQSVRDLSDAIRDHFLIDAAS